MFPVGGQTASRGLPHTGCEVEVVAGPWPAAGFYTPCRVYVLGVATPALLFLRHKEPALAFKANYPSKDLGSLHSQAPFGCSWLDLYGIRDTEALDQ